MVMVTWYLKQHIGFDDLFKDRVKILKFDTKL